jgi:hypothetical protein
VDERGGQHQPQERAENEPDGRLPPRVEGRDEQVLGERRLGAPLERLAERDDDVPDVRQPQVVGEVPAKRRVPQDRVVGSRKRARGAPRHAAQELDALPGDEDREDDADIDKG